MIYSNMLYPHRWHSHSFRPGIFSFSPVIAFDKLMRNKIRTKILRRTLTFMDIHLDLMRNFSLLIFLQRSFILVGRWCVSGITFFQGARRGQKEKKIRTTNASNIREKTFINKDVLSDTCKVEKIMKRTNGLAFTAYFYRLLPCLQSREESVSVRKLLLKCQKNQPILQSPCYSRDMFRLL